MNIQAINAELAKIGYKAVKLPKAKREWQPQTAAGRACKARMAFWAKMPKVDWSPRKPCVDSLLRFFGYRGVGAHEIGGFNPKGLWIASISKHYARQVTFQP